jgi:Xaa-Pro aminopeptidase
MRFFVGRPGEREVMEEAEIWVQPCHESRAIGILPTVSATADELRARGLDGGRLAVELSSLPADALVTLQRELPHAAFVDAAEILDPLRAIKTEREINIIRDGSRRNLEGVSAAFLAGHDGVTTTAVAQRVQEEFSKRGLHFLYALVCAGPHFFRAPSDTRTWDAGRPLHIDAGGLLDGYAVEVCRMGHLGPPSAGADDLLGACRSLRDEVLTVLRPGAGARDIQKHADAYLASSRFGDIGKFIGHGIGLVHHEDPVVSLASDHVLQTGMVLSIEMEYRHSEIGHIKVEELVVITKDGNELITPNGEKWTIAAS